MTRKDNEKMLACSFCKKNQNEVAKLVAGPSVYVCDECIKLCNRIIEQDYEKQKENEEISLPTPHNIKNFLDQYVISQEEAKKVLAVAVYNHYKRINASSCAKDLSIKKSNVLLIGPTGTGKTLLVTSLARMLHVPFCAVDATSLTEAGYVGDDCESILQSLLSAADNNPQKASRGIVYIDEIDKIAKKGNGNHAARDVSGEGVQQSLLKLIEGSIVAVSPKGAKKYGQPEQVIHLDTKDILFICGGAFCGLFEIISKRAGYKAIGFNKDHISSSDKEREFPSPEPSDLISYGFIPEFVGRLPVTACLEDIRESDLVKILCEPKNALIKQYQKLFALEGVDLQFTNDAVLEIAKKALAKKSGARGLRSVIENAMLDIMYSVPFIDGVKHCTITKDVIDGTGNAKLIFEEKKQSA